MEQEYKKWLSQLRKGYIELYTLLALKKSNSLHGLGLLKYFAANGLLINEGTLYPLLNRMEQNKWLDSLWVIPENKGHPKKEYKISSHGEMILPKLMDEYLAHDKSIKKLMETE